MRCPSSVGGGRRPRHCNDLCEPHVNRVRARNSHVACTIDTRASGPARPLLSRRTGKCFAARERVLIHYRARFFSAVTVLGHVLRRGMSSTLLPHAVFLGFFYEMCPLLRRW